VYRLSRQAGLILSEASTIVPDNPARNQAVRYLLYSLLEPVSFSQAAATVAILFPGATR
jgi:hypothetical protein